MEIKGKQSIVVIDHLKPAYLETSELTHQPEISPSSVSPSPPLLQNNLLWMSCQIAQVAY